MHEGLSQRLARQFRQKIETGEWAVGKRLPTTRALAAELKVSINTIQNAFRQLEAHNLVERRPRLGGFVKARPAQQSFAGGANPATRRATTIGVVSPFTDTPDADDFAHGILRGLTRELGSAGFHFAMYPFSFTDSDPVRSLLTTIDRAGTGVGGVAGILCFPSPPILGLLDQLDRRAIPWVTINRTDMLATHNFVTFDALNGSRLVGRCFAKKGIDQAVVLSDSFGPGRTTSVKFFGFLQGFVEAGMPSRNVDFVNCNGYQEAAGHQAFRQHVEKYGPPKGVYTSGDFLALGAVRLAREMGLSIPDQMAIVGSTGLHTAAYANPPMTVLQIPLEAMGEAAAQLLVHMARNGVQRMEGRIVPASLVVRKSFVIAEDEINQIKAEMQS
jgi:LacI family transcriptional regulator